MDKHRSDSVGNDLRFTLDDYLHVVDTALWLAGGQARLRRLAANHGPGRNALCRTPVQFAPAAGHHQHAPSRRQREWVQAVTDGVCDMREWQEERGHGVVSARFRLANHA
jgi:virulence factor